MIKLYKGDCLIESDKIESGSVDLILTDLPYGTMKKLKKVIFTALRTSQNTNGIVLLILIK
jgi:DNA modification methylase